MILVGKKQKVLKDMEGVKIEKARGLLSTCLMNIKHGETTFPSASNRCWHLSCVKLTVWCLVRGINSCLRVHL